MKIGTERTRTMRRSPSPSPAALAVSELWPFPEDAAEAAGDLDRSMFGSPEPEVVDSTTQLRVTKLVSLT